MTEANTEYRALNFILWTNTTLQLYSNPNHKMVVTWDAANLQSSSLAPVETLSYPVLTTC